MASSKKERVETARKAAAARQRKAVGSLRICFIRVEVMRRHHDALIHEASSQGGVDYIGGSDVKKARFITYISYWFAALSAVIERYQELTRRGAIPSHAPLDALLTAEKIDLVKPFRNAIAHCSDHDDERVLNLLDNAATVPDWAEEVSRAFRAYMDLYDEPPAGTRTPNGEQPGT